MPFLQGLQTTVDPGKGNGWAETVIFLALIFTMTYLLVTGQKVPSELWGLIGLVVGYFVGGNATGGDS